MTWTQDPDYSPTQLLLGVHRDHVGIGQDKVSRKGQVSVSMMEGGGEEGRRGGRRRSPAHLPVLGREPRVAG